MSIFKSDQTCLFEAISSRDYSEVKRLISKGCSLSRGVNKSVSSKREETPYHYAVWCRDITLDQLKVMDPSNFMYPGLQADLKNQNAIIRLIEQNAKPIDRM
jgi:hypothetical protein